MPMFSYKCPEHGEFTVSLYKRDNEYPCVFCGGKCLPLIKPASYQVVERLDNGAMARRVERLHNIEEIMNNRADKHSKETKKRLGISDDDE